MLISLANQSLQVRLALCTLKRGLEALGVRARRRLLVFKAKRFVRHRELLGGCARGRVVFTQCGDRFIETCDVILQVHNGLSQRGNVGSTLQFMHQGLGPRPRKVQHLGCRWRGANSAL